MYKTELIPQKPMIADNCIEIHTISNNNNIKNENNCNWKIRFIHTEQINKKKYVAKASFFISTYIHIVGHKNIGTPCV